jgi:VRR-NUC domain/FAN1, HTH domain
MSHPRPFYYLENFCTALAWLQERYGDLLSEPELAFMATFHQLPRESGGLLVRMLGRKGDLFRTAKLLYPEIGCPSRAAVALIDLGWVDHRPLLTLEELVRLFNGLKLPAALSAELGAASLRAAGKKRGFCRQVPLWAADDLAGCARGPWGTEPRETRALLEWWPEAPDVAYRVVVKPICERLRRLFFGNFRQEWSEFVLADLGIFKYEPVGLDPAARAFQTREHVETFHELYSCRQKLEEGAEIAAILQSFPAAVADNDWLESKRRKLQFLLAHSCERRQELLPQALAIYRDCLHPGARLRTVRVLERLDRIPEALELAELIRDEAVDDVDCQLIGRMLPRLQRKAGVVPQKRSRSQGWSCFDLVLPTTQRPSQLERATGDALSQPDAPVYFVESGLLGALFGLLCWEALFAPVPGAFFHPFQAAPADLEAREFRSRRASAFARCLQQLETGAYRDTIRANFERKQGTQAPFVFWGLLDPALLDLALDCIPADHLRACLERFLANIRANRSGLPDLVQFWPGERRYRLIEVKGPGDRLQDNQIRWLEFCGAHAIPAAVCHVRWGGAGA